MARKKPQRKPEGPKRSVTPPRTTTERRSIEASLRQLTSTNLPQDTPLNKAQRLVEQAYVEGNTVPIAELAQQALAICADCADALVLLAEQARNRQEAIALFRQGVAAGERALGPAFFEREAGRFWLILDTRPYMRARRGLALTLWSAGHQQESIDHLTALLYLNPGDNQGNRYHLAQRLLFLDRDADVRKLLQTYPDEDSCAWAYTHALLLFRAEGDTIEARRALKQARKANSHVPAFLLGHKDFPHRPPQTYRLGDAQEAILYAQNFLFGWKYSAGAIPWLRKESKAKSKETPAPVAQGPVDAVKKNLKSQEQQGDDIWQVGLAQMPEWMKIGDTMVRPWAMLVLSTTNEMVLAHELFEEAPSTDQLWDSLVKAIRHPAGGDAHRPGQILLRTDPGLASLRPHLENIGIAVGSRENLEQLDRIFASMCEHLGTERRPGLLDSPGMHLQQVARFFHAAASFYREALWKQVPSDRRIQVSGELLPRGPQFATVMGQSGLTIGISLTQGAIPSIRGQGPPTGLCLMYGEEWDIPVADLEAIRANDWPIARSDAFPHLFYTGSDNPMRPPLPDEIEVLTACLLELPAFVKQEMKGKSGREKKVKTKRSDIKALQYTWMPDS